MQNDAASGSEIAGLDAFVGSVLAKLEKRRVVKAELFSWANLPGAFFGAIWRIEKMGVIQMLRFSLVS